jgi:peptidylprolyl isomerase
VAADEVVARVGKTDITAAEVRAFIETLSPEERAALSKEPSLLNQVVRTMLTRQAVLAEALTQKWDQQPETQAQLKRVREGAIMESWLQSVSTPPKDFPSDADLQKAYEANQTAFLVPRQFRLSQIFVEVQKGADKAAEDKAREKVEEIRKKLKQKGADFGAIAQAESNAKDTASRLGEIGWLFEGQIRPEIREQVAGLAKDAVSDPIRLDDGWHIIKLLDTKAGYARPLSEVREQLTAQLRAERAVVLRQAHIAKLLEENRAAINELALSRLLPKSDETAAPKQ